MSEVVASTVPQADTKTASEQKNGVGQRKCACGQHTVAGGECEACRQKRLKVQGWDKGRAGPVLLTADLAAAAGTMTPRFGVDFTHVQLRTPRPFIQRMPGDETASIPDAAAVPAPAPTEARPAPEPAMPESTPTEPTSQSTTPGETAVPGLLVEDEATDLDEGQMRKSEFLAELRPAVCAAADAELAAAGRNSEGCPYLDYWFDYYSQRDAAHGERVLRRYAPEAATATSAREYIPIVAERVRQGVARWVRTGEISGVPEGVPTTVPGEPPAAGSNGAVQFRARDGGAKAHEDPEAIRDRLGHGRPLDSGVRARMESAFGTSFSHVRLHNDNHATGLSSDLNARAFTVGEHVAFGAGEYQPGTMLGDALIAHELAHVIQQGGATESLANMQVGDAGYDALEKDADRTAVSIVHTLWKNNRIQLAQMGRNAMPLLRSGLRLSRCKDDKKTTEGLPKGEAPKETAPGERPASPGSGEGGSSATGVTHAADLKCEPEPKTLNEVGSIPGASGNTAGYTKAAPISLGLAITSEAGNCKLVMSDEPRLSLLYHVYTKAGDYKVGTTTIPFDPCKGKVADYYYRFTPEMSKKIKEGEIEHCEDQKLAFALSYERYVKAVKEVAATPFPGSDVPTCQAETMKRLKEKSGIEVSKWKSTAQCLLDKTLERDKSWHAVDPDPAKGTLELTADCKKITLVFDHTKQLTEVGKHTSVDVVKGCGEKSP